MEFLWMFIVLSSVWVMLMWCMCGSLVEKLRFGV